MLIAKRPLTWFLCANSKTETGQDIVSYAELCDIEIRASDQLNTT